MTRRFIPSDWRSVLATFPEDIRDAWEERAAIIEFDGREPRPTAERRAFECVVGAIRGSGYDLAEASWRDLHAPFEETRRMTVDGIVQPLRVKLHAQATAEFRQRPLTCSVAKSSIGNNRLALSSRRNVPLVRAMCCLAIFRRLWRRFPTKIWPRSSKPFPSNSAVANRSLPALTAEHKHPKKSQASHNHQSRGTAAHRVPSGSRPRDFQSGRETNRDCSAIRRQSVRR